MGAERNNWYPLDGDHGVEACLELLAQRAAAKKPPAVKPGDPTDLLGLAEAADALHIEPSTLRSYVRYSIPYWTGDEQGRPLLPPPDHETEIDEPGTPPYTRREWNRSTLAAHQTIRPGSGRTQLRVAPCSWQATPGPASRGVEPL